MLDWSLPHAHSASSVFNFDAVDGGRIWRMDEERGPLLRGVCGGGDFERGTRVLVKRGGWMIRKGRGVWECVKGAQGVGCTIFSAAADLRIANAGGF